MQFTPISSASLECVNILWTSALDGTTIDPTGQASGQPELNVEMAFPVSSGDYAAPAAPVTWYAASWLAGGTGKGYYAQCLVGPAGTAVLAAGTYDVYSRIVTTPESPVKFAGVLTVY